MSVRAFATVAVLAALAGPARAQSAAFDAEQFHPSATSNGYFAVDGAFVARHLGFSAALYATYAHDPLVLRRDGAIPYPGGEIIIRQLGMDAVASFALLDRLELGIDLPFVPYQLTDNTLANLPGLTGSGLGDLAIDVKGLLFAPRVGAHRFGVSLIAGLTAPTGDADSFMGAGTVTGRPRLVGEWRSPWLWAAIDLGFVLRPERDFADLHVTHQFQYGLALATPPLPYGFAVVGTLRGLVGMALPDGASLTSAEAPAELAVGLRWQSKLGLMLEAAIGAGLSRGYGTPDRARGILGIRYTTPEPRRRAPPPPEPTPLPPPAAKVVEPVAPPVDSDQDGLPDAVDQCPLQRGPKQYHGCPPPDRDHDGVADPDDRCPDRAGVVENQGCPDFDSDGDGFVDRLDKCPFDPETFNGVADDDGCPDQPAALAALVGDKLVIFEPVLFEKDGSVVDKRSYKLLGVVAHILKLHPEILKMRVEGHMDNKGPPLELLDLSRARAAAVRRWLVRQGGVDPGRLVAEGFGSDRPIADNRDFIGRAKNRRIEFVVMQRLDAAP